MVEMLGAERLVYGRLGDTRSPCASTPRCRHRIPATRVPLGVAGEHLHWFDARRSSGV